MWLCSSKLPIHSVSFLCFLLIYYISYYFCLRSCKSHPQENETFMSKMGQFSCTDSLLFKDRSFSSTLDLIDLVMQIQPAQKGWTLKPGVSVKQCKMFHFWMLKSIIRQESVMYQIKIQSLGFFLVFWLRLCKSHPLENEKFTKTMSRLSRKDSLALKKRNLGCTVIDLVMKIKPFKGVNTKAWHFLLKKE